MGIRDTLNKNPAVAITGIGVLIVLAGLMLYRGLNPGMGGAPADKAYYSIDDGATFFVDDMLKCAPFQKDGKEAVRAHVFLCDGKRMVGYLEKYTPEAKAELEKARSAGDRAGQRRIEIDGGSRLVKKPKAKNWVPSGSPEGAMISFPPKCNGVDAEWALPE